MQERKKSNDKPSKWKSDSSKARRYYAELDRLVNNLLWFEKITVAEAEKHRKQLRLLCDYLGSWPDYILIYKDESGHLRVERADRPPTVRGKAATKGLSR